MRLRFVGPEPRDSWITFLLREGYTLDSAGARLGRLPAVETAPAGAGLASRLWQAATAAAKVARPAAVSREVSARRSEAMRGFFPKLASWYEQRMHLADMREVDRFLAQSTDLVDLERRIHEIERRGSASRWF